MTGNTHKKVAIVTVSAITATTMAITLSPITVAHPQVPAFIPLLWIPLSIPGGLSPDLDEPQAKAARWFRRLFIFTTPLFLILLLVALFRNMHLIVIASIVGTFILTAAIRFISIYTQHRRETHSLFFLAILLAISYALAWSMMTIHPWLTLITWNLGIGFTLGAFSHMLVDNFNIKPQHWFYPIEHITRNIKTGKLRLYIPTIFKIRTGSPEEQFFNKVYPVVVAFICVIIVGLYHLL